MGCSQSKIENEEAVSRCKERKAFMKSAVTSRNAFAAAHVSYAMSLKNAGAAVTDFAQGEVANPLSLSSHSVGSGVGGGVGSAIAPPQPPPPSIGTLPPPPPPVPDMPPPLQRASSMPEFVVSKPPGLKPAAEETIDEEEEEEEGEEEEEDVGRLRRRRENKGGSVGGRIETTPTPTANVVGPPPPPEERETRTPPPPPMPDMHGGTWDYFFNTEDMPGGSLRDEREEYDHTIVYHQRAMRASGPQPSVTMTASPSIEVVEELVMPGSEKPPLPSMGGGGGRVLKKGKQVMGKGGSGGDGRRSNVNLVKIFGDLDDCFLKASESAHQVSKMLEATRLHYHSNFADNRGNSSSSSSSSFHWF